MERLLVETVGTNLLAQSIGINGAWRSLVARLLWEQDAGGSNPSAPTKQQGRSNMKSFVITLGIAFINLKT